MQCVVKLQYDSQRNCIGCKNILIQCKTNIIERVFNKIKKGGESKKKIKNNYIFFTKNLKI